MQSRRILAAVPAMTLIAGLTAAAPAEVTASDTSLAPAAETQQASEQEGQMSAQWQCGKIITQPNRNETKYWWRNCKDGYGGDYVVVDRIWAPDEYWCVPPGETWDMGSAFMSGPPLGEPRDVRLIKTQCPYWH